MSEDNEIIHFEISKDEDIETEAEEEVEEEVDEEDDDEEEAEEETGEEVEVEILEFALNYEDINELIEKLEMLKETRKPIEFDIDDENQLLINFDEEYEEEGEDSDKEGGLNNA